MFQYLIIRQQYFLRSLRFNSPRKDSQNSLYCTTFQLFNSLHFVSSFSHTYFKIFEFLFFGGGRGGAINNYCKFVKAHLEG